MPTKGQPILRGCRAPWLDVSATVDDSGYVNLIVVNIGETESFDVELKGVGSDVTLYEVLGENVSSANAAGEENVSLVERKWDGQGKFTFPKHSITMLSWSAV